MTGLSPCCAGAARSEAGAIFVKLDRLDGTAALYGPAPQALADPDGVTGASSSFSIPIPRAIEERVERERRFDSDLWLVEIENRRGDPRLDLVEP
jgi:hypothetical protein